MMRRLWIEALPAAGDDTVFLPSGVVLGDDPAVSRSVCGTCLPVDLSLFTTPAERAQAAVFSPTRRREFLAWRALVRRELGNDVQIAYNAVGAPVVTNRAVHISVSHGARRVAVGISDRQCGVDIESLNRNFSRVATRYITSSEARLSSDPRLGAALWCAKEALYKYAGVEGLDFLEEIHLTEVDFAAGWMVGRIKNGEPLRLSVYFGEDFLAVYLL